MVLGRLETQGDEMYKCLNCGKKMNIDLKTAKKIICPYCGYKIVEKVRPRIVKKVPTI